MAKTAVKPAVKPVKKVQSGDPLLREAIATAKSVKAVSLANAKFALQEAFNGKLQSIYATKVKEALKDEDEGVEGDFAKEEPDELATGFDQDQKRLDPTIVHKNEMKVKREGKDATNDQGADPEAEKAGAVGSLGDGEESGSETATDSGKSKYVPAVYEEEIPGEEEVPGEEVPGEEVPGEEGAPEIEVPEEPGEKVDIAVEPGAEGVPGEEGSEADEDAVELEAIIKELEAEEGELNDEPFAGEETPGEEDAEKLTGVPAEEAVDITADQSADPEKEKAGAIAPDAGSGSETATETQPTTDADPVGIGGEGKPFGQGPGAEEEELDLENLVKEIEGEMGAEGEPEDDEKEKEFDLMKTENTRLMKSLKEHRKVVIYLKNKLNEINLLNGKLLYSNKLFRSASLSEAQKLRVIEAIDRANTIREVKLVYATLAESFKLKGTKINESKKPTRQTASKPVGSTKPTVLTEGQDLAARFKQLSGVGSGKQTIKKFL